MAKVELSFRVVEIKERLHGNIVIYETTLRHYSSGQTFIVRGKPWEIDTKVDFLSLPIRRTRKPTTKKGAK